MTSSWSKASHSDACDSYRAAYFVFAPPPPPHLGSFSLHLSALSLFLYSFPYIASWRQYSCGRRGYRQSRHHLGDPVMAGVFFSLWAGSSHCVTYLCTLIGFVTVASVYQCAASYLGGVHRITLLSFILTQPTLLESLRSSRSLYLSFLLCHSSFSLSGLFCLFSEVLFFTLSKLLICV